MNINEAVITRKSIRHYIKEKPPDEESMKAVLDLTRYAPSAGNCKGVVCSIIRKDGLISELSRAANQGWIDTAPVVIVVCADISATQCYGKRGFELYSIQNSAIVGTYILLSATANGLGSCWVGAFDEEQVRNILNLEESLRPMALITVGYEKKE